jgi:hypothetical protein
MAILPGIGTAEEATPYLERFVVSSSYDDDDGEGGDDGCGSTRQPTVA